MNKFVAFINNEIKQSSRVIACGQFTRNEFTGLSFIKFSSKSDHIILKSIILERSESFTNPVTIINHMIPIQRVAMYDTVLKITARSRSAIYSKYALYC